MCVSFPFHLPRLFYFRPLDDEIFKPRSWKIGQRYTNFKTLINSLWNNNNLLCFGKINIDVWIVRLGHIILSLFEIPNKILGPKR
jgi:hypothetical protein